MTKNGKILLLVLVAEQTRHYWHIFCVILLKSMILQYILLIISECGRHDPGSGQRARSILVVWEGLGTFVPRHGLETRGARRSGFLVAARGRARSDDEGPDPAAAVHWRHVNTGGLASETHLVNMCLSGTLG